VAHSYLREYCTIFGQALRTAFSEINRCGKLENKKELTGLQKKVCKTLEQRFGILNAEAKNAFDQALAVYESQSALTSFVNGALGVDFNPGSIDWAVCDKHGNLKCHGSIKINVQDKRSNQTEDIIGKAVAQIVRVAEQYVVPVVIEDLDFAKKKNSLREKGKKYARMLSNMAYSQFMQRMESRCSRTGTELVKVDAAYTSVIGVTKYMAMYGLNSGCAAALVVARRGQGRTEKLPASHARFFKRPEDLLKYRAWGTLSRQVNLCGSRNRHRWYCGGNKQVRSNPPLYGKLRQTCRKLQTVQVLRAPYIHKKTSANCSLGIST
jgi:IS605 OrfB family transposase